MRTLLLLAAAATLSAATVKSDGARVHYRSYGSGRQAVVFIHGWTCNLGFWDGQAPVYEKRRSLLVDLPGHGASDKPVADYTGERFARAVEAVLRKERVAKAILVGHSMGVTVTAAFLRLYPERVAGVVIVDGSVPQPLRDPAERAKRREAGEATSKVYRGADYRAAATKAIDSMFVAATTAELRDRIRAEMLATPQHVMASAREGMTRFSLDLAEEPRSQAPALALMAKRPGVDRTEYKEYLQRVFPNLRGFQEWEGAGHFLMMEQPERFNAALEAFLSVIPR